MVRGATVATAAMPVPSSETVTIVRFGSSVVRVTVPISRTSGSVGLKVKANITSPFCSVITGRVSPLPNLGFEKVAAACFEEVVVDLNAAPIKSDRIPRLIVDLAGQAQKAGLRLKVVGPAEVAKLLTAFTDTASIPFFGTVDQAKAA